MSDTKVLFDSADVAENRSLGIVMAIFPYLFFLAYTCDSNKHSAYVKHCANQALMLLLLCFASSVIWILAIIAIIFYIMNIVNAVKANGEPVPVIGDWRIIK